MTARGRRGHRRPLFVVSLQCRGSTRLCWGHASLARAPEGAEPDPPLATRSRRWTVEDVQRLRGFDGETAAEAARLLGQPFGAVHRHRARLRQPTQGA